MKILNKGKQQYYEPEFNHVKCEKCGFEAMLDKDDVVEECPNCGEQTMLSFDFVSDTQNASCTAKGCSDHIPVFPDEFEWMETSNGCVNVPRARMNELIKTAVSGYKKNDCGYCYAATGNAFVAVFQDDPDDIDKYVIVVARNYAQYDSEVLEDGGY